jgi:hypothetical protein
MTAHWSSRPAAGILALAGMVVALVAAAADVAFHTPSLHAQGPGGTQTVNIAPGEQCPPGMTEIRPRR